MNHSQVLDLKDGDRVVAQEDGGVVDRPRYQKGDRGVVKRSEFGCPMVMRDDQTDLGYVHFRNWSLETPREEQPDRRHRIYGDMDADAASYI